MRLQLWTLTGTESLTEGSLPWGWREPAPPCDIPRQGWPTPQHPAQLPQKRLDRCLQQGIILWHRHQLHCQRQVCRAGQRLSRCDRKGPPYLLCWRMRGFTGSNSFRSFSLLEPPLFRAPPCHLTPRHKMPHHPISCPRAVLRCPEQLHLLAVLLSKEP